MGYIACYLCSSHWLQYILQHTCANYDTGYSVLHTSLSSLLTASRYFCFSISNASLCSLRDSFCPSNLSCSFQSLLSLWTNAGGQMLSTSSIFHLCYERGTHSYINTNQRIQPVHEIDSQHGVRMSIHQPMTILHYQVLDSRQMLMLQFFVRFTHAYFTSSSVTASGGCFSSTSLCRQREKTAV